MKNIRAVMQLEYWYIFKDTRYSKETAFDAIINQPFVGLSNEERIKYEVKYQELYGK